MENILKFDNVKIVINSIIILILVYEFYRMYIADTKTTHKSRAFIRSQLKDKWGLCIIGIMISLVVIINIYNFLNPNDIHIEKYKRGITFGFLAWLVACFSAMGYTVTLFYIVVFLFVFFNFRLV